MLGVCIDTRTNAIGFTFFKNLFLVDSKGIEYKFLTVFPGFASFSSGRVGPHADARVLVKVQTRWADDLYSLAFNAVVEDVADTFVWVCEVSVPSGAQPCGLRRF